MDIQETVGPISDPTKIQLQGKIGRGLQGTVYNACHVETKQKYAVKVMNTSNMTEKELQRMRSQIQSNFSVSSQCSFRYFPYFHGYWSTSSHTYLVFEKCEGNALDGLRLSRTPSRSYSFAYVLLYDILKALQLLQKRNIIHRDLKPENILLDKGMFKVCDLGLSKIAKKGRRLTVDVGNVMSRSPEFYSGNYDCKTDIWSLGINTFWIAFGSLPFEQQIKQMLYKSAITDIIHKISKVDFEVKLGPIHTNLVDILKDMLQIDKNKRLSASELLEKHFSADGSLKTDLFSQKKILFKKYLASRIQTPQCNYYLIMMLLLIDFSRNDQHIRQPFQEGEEGKRQLVRIMKLNIFLLLKLVIWRMDSNVSLEVRGVLSYYQEIWQIELSFDEKNKNKIHKTYKNWEQALQLHKSKSIADKFPLLPDAVALCIALEGAKSICLWDLSNLDLRRLKI